MQRKWQVYILVSSLDRFLRVYSSGADHLPEMNPRLDRVFRCSYFRFLLNKCFEAEMAVVVVVKAEKTLRHNHRMVKPEAHSRAVKVVMSSICSRLLELMKLSRHSHNRR